MGEAKRRKEAAAAGIPMAPSGWRRGPGRRVMNRWSQGPKERATMVVEWLTEAFRALGKLAQPAKLPQGKAATQAVDRRRTSVRTP